MQKKPFAKQSRLLSMAIRLGLSLVLGILTVLLLISLVSVASHSLAPTDPSGPSDLDVTFGNGGVVTTPIGPGDDYASDVAIQPDGKIVAAGFANNGSDEDFALVRYTVSGAPDTAFGSGGIAITSIGPGNDYAYDAAIQPDGKIVGVGCTYNGSDYDFALARYTVYGTLDAAFGSGGVVTTSISPVGNVAKSVAIQPDGKIVAAGFANNGSDEDFALVRYTVSGAPDTAFGSGGVVTTPISPGDDYAWDVAIQPDGKIVAAGSANNGSDDDFALARYTVSGTLDAAFGSGGVVTTPISPGDDYAQSVAIQPDGKIVVAGFANNGSDYDFALARYTVSGTLDTAFGSGGVVTTSISPVGDFAQSVAIQPNGKIVAAGNANNGSDNDFALTRYTVSGTLDAAFGSGGVVTTSISPFGDVALSVASQPDGKIVAAGHANNGSNEDFALVRYGTGHSVYLPLVLKNL